MKLNTTFEVVAKCYEFENFQDLRNLEKYRTAPIENISLEFDRISASCFLFKNQKNCFRINNIIIHMRFDPNHVLNGIILIDSANNKVVYYVINLDEFFNTVVEGYIRLRTIDKLGSLLELDFEDTKREDEEGLIDEFDIEESDEQQI